MTVSRVCFGDVVREVKVNVDRANNPHDYYVAGDHMDTEELRIMRRGNFSAPPEPGPAFIRFFKSGQILYGSRRTYLKKIAVADFEGVCANTTFVLETKNNSVFLQQLLPFLMYSERFTQYSINNSKGSTNPYILFSDLAKYEFDLPPLAEQRKLAELFWAANAAREAYKKLLAVTDELVKSQFIEMFGDENKYDFVLMRDVAQIAGGLTKNESKRKHYALKIPYLRVANVFFNRFDLAEVLELPIAPSEMGKGLLKQGDLLFVEGNGSIEQVGRVAVWDGSIDPCVHQNHLIKARLNLSKTSPIFVLHYFMSQDGRKQIMERAVSTSGLHTLSVSKIENMRIPLPPLSLQNQFAAFVEQADKSKFALQRSLEELESTYKALLSEHLG
jgi:type I restriction enzyme S subunit